MNERKTDKTLWPKIRKFFNDVHLWLGLSSGLIVILVCFSGTLYVFNTELTEWGAPHLYKVERKAGGRISPDSLLTKVELASGGKVTSVTVSRDMSRTYQFNVKKEGDKSRGGIAYMVDPYTGEITGNSKEKNGAKEFMSSMFSLHRWLLLDKIEEPIFSNMTNRELGSMITGWATILFTLGCITGLIIWFPRKVRNWKQGLTIRFRANWKRVNHDLHNTLAFYSLIFLIIMGLTGPQWSFPWYRDGLQKTLGTYKPKPAEKDKAGQSGSHQRSQRGGSGPAGGDSRRSAHAGSEQGASARAGAAQDRRSAHTHASAGAHSTAGDTARRESAGTDRPVTAYSIASFIAAANKVVSYEGDVTVSLPADAEAPVQVSKNRVGFFASPAADRITLDQTTGAVVKTEIFRNKPFNERIAGSIKALHIGNVYGMFTKILYFLACLIATSLPVTGTLIWLNKLKKKNRRTLPVSSVRSGLPREVSVQ